MKVIPIRPKKTSPPAARRPHVGRLGARPRLGKSEQPRLGLQPLNMAEERDGLLYVARGYRHSQPAPLIVCLHGAGSNAQHGLAPLLNFADQAGAILLAPESRERTWDVVLGEFGPDASLIDQALEAVFERYSIDRSRLAIGGFSDGASYALSLGMMNGDIFSHIVAFSPGFAAPGERVGNPKIFVSHGIWDTVLPIDSCSRRIVNLLKQAGYEVRYHEFDGAHTVPMSVALEAMNWLKGA